MIRTKELAEWLDDKLPFDEWVGGLAGRGLEMADRYVLSFALEFAGKKVDEKYHEEINTFILGVINEDYDKVKGVSTIRLVSILKTPLGDAKEKIIIGGFLTIIFQLLDLEKESIMKTQENNEPGQGPSDPDPG